MRAKILSINGNNSMNYLLKTSVGTKYDMITVNTVTEGINILKNTEIQGILIDVDYDSEENLNFIHFIKDSSIYKKPCIILSSSQVLDHELESSQYFDSILKPFDPTNLIKTADRLITAH